MPQINRIRVNNVKYNFGTQYYDDFVMNFSCKNTIYDLANGGGKSVLMLLLLQNLIPNCTLDDKQPVEKLFRTQNGSKVIHSLIEWKLDNAYRVDGFKYMTTGFCARKAKDSEEDENKDNAGIEYFNYCIFYKEFGDYDIKNIPLTENGERITYNGLKSYIRGIEKNGISVTAKIFDRKSDYQNFIAGYGLHESHWEIIRGINKTEGHVRTYFESNYRTSRKVVEDLLIEGIIQKSYNARIGIEDNEEDMSKTLIDIKDKLVELTKKRDMIASYDGQINALSEFGESIKVFRDLMSEKNTIQNMLTDYLLKCRTLIKNTEKEIEALENDIENIRLKIEQEKKLIATAKVMEDEKSLNEMKAEEALCKEKLDNILAQQKDKKQYLTKLEAAMDYRDYLEYKILKEEVLITIDNSMKDKGEIMSELADMARIKKADFEEKLTKLSNLKKEQNDKVSELKEKYDGSLEEEHKLEVELAITENNIKIISKQLQDETKILSQMLSECEVVVGEQLEEMIAFEKENCDAIDKKKAKDLAELSKYQSEYNELVRQHIIKNSEAEAANMLLKDIDAQLAQMDTTKDKLDALSKVYGIEDLEELKLAVEDNYRRYVKDSIGIDISIKKMENYMDNLKLGKVVLTGRQYEMVGEYLEKTYGNDVVSGIKWLEKLDITVRQAIVEKVPFIEYAYVIKNDFERILKDKKIESFMESSYVIPIVSEKIAEDYEGIIDKKLVTFGRQNFDFLEDKEKLKEAIGTARRELELLYAQRDNLLTRMLMVEEDYRFLSEYAAGYEEKSKKLDERREELNNQITQASQAVESYEQETEEKKTGIERLKADIEAAEKNYKVSQDNYQKYVKAFEKDKTVEELNKKQQELNNNCKELKNQLESRHKTNVEQESEYKNAIKHLTDIEDKISEEEAKWKNIYAVYYREGTAKVSDKLPLGEDFEARFLGLKAVAENTMSDVNDKNKLAAAYEASMEKCVKSIEYRGFTLDSVKEEYDSLTINLNKATALKELKQEINNLEIQYREGFEDISARSAQINRIEGSISHAVGLIEENYGKYEAFECEDLQKFIKEHMAQQIKAEENYKLLHSREKSVTDSVSKIKLMERDILRITGNAGIDMPENALYEGKVTLEDIADYEKTEKQFNVLIKNESRQRENFADNRLKLSKKLEDYGALDLSLEVMGNINAPQKIGDIEDMLEKIAEINRCIALERDSLSSGIADMEMIKDNFENRCLQTCVNIRSELERLPALSKIVLEDETISIIGLSIPYIKEEFYKERMEEYIDETIAIAENYKEYDERVKYIKSRLAWKRLFSAIVTDMNLIRLNLYKRERIKAQSRYLRYEEAVGSTGQSQGIYIQFLIAVINYIANVNAPYREMSVMGNSIFIDNPFGAAKDIYIWEPIFKLLKTNHIQLIVPARGATPAITGRFDVNYILGQKMSGNMQQTVVVEYVSNVDNEKLDYETIEYTQSSLFD